MSLLDAHGHVMRAMYRGTAWQPWFHGSQGGSLCDVTERRSSASFIKPSNISQMNYTQKRYFMYIPSQSPQALSPFLVPEEM